MNPKRIKEGPAHMSANRSPLPGWALTGLLITGIIAISFSSIFIRWSDAPASIMAMYRLLLTSLLVLPFVIRSRPSLSGIHLKDWGLMVASGIFLALHFLFWMESLSLTSVASSTILLALEPIFILGGAYWVFRERTTAKAVIGMSTAILGAALIGWGDIGISGQALKGDLLSFLGTAAVAVHMLIGQSAAKRVPSLLYSLTVFLVAALAFLIYNLSTSVPVTGYSQREWGIFLLLAIVPTVFGHVLFNWLLQYVNAATVSMSVLGEPVGATLLAYLMLDESLNPLQAVAGLIIIFGVWYFLRHNKVRYEESGHSPSGYSAPSADLHSNKDHKAG
jgi:drug/metabolite transporter (DMT)-like permease